MHQRLRPLLTTAITLLLAVGAARASEVRVIASDASGVTLKVTTGAWTLDPRGDEGRVVPTCDGLSRTTDTGRPRLPYASALLAMPPGARATVRLLSSGTETTREGVHVAITGKPGAEMDPRLGAMPTVTPVPAIRDGAWPVRGVELGAPFSMRERRLVPVEIYPFHYDETAARLTVASEMIVRVDFSGGRAATTTLDDAPDPQFDAAFATQVVNWDQAKGWRARRPQARQATFGRTRTGATSLSVPGVNSPMLFDESFPEVRVRIDTTGIYELDYDSLAAFGYPAGVPISQVSVHRHEFMEAQNPPYETIDLPIEVFDDNSNGVFDSGDRIWLWVWDWASRSRASVAQLEWGKAEVIYVTESPGALRTDHRVGFSGRNDLTPPTSYPYRRTWEQHKGFFAYPSDTLMEQFPWTPFSYYCTPDAFPVETNDLDPSKPGNLTVRWSGLNGLMHITWASLTSGTNVTTVAVDSAVWAGIHLETRSGALAPGSLTEGATNTLKIWGKTNPGENCSSATPITAAGLQSFTLDYWRAYKPIAEYLSCNSGAQASDFEIRAGPFAFSQPFVYDVTDSTHPVHLDNVDLAPGAGGTFVRLQDTATPTLQKQYVILDSPRFPAPGAFSAVHRAQTWNNTAGDYLVIVPEAFQSAIQPLVDLRRSEGWRVVVAPLESVQDEFNGGRKSSYAIKRFVRFGYNNWNARFVLLVGDGSLDPLMHFDTSSPDVVPVQKMFGPVPTVVGPDFVREIVPSDFWYVWCMNCTDPSATNLIPDLYVGRLPVSSVSQLNGVVSKLVAYEDLSGDQSWRRKNLLVSDDAYSTTTTFGGGGGGTVQDCRKPEELVFADITATLDSLVRKTAGLAQTQDDIFDLSYYLPNRPGEFTAVGLDTCRNDLNMFQTRCRATATPDMFNRLSAGRMWCNYQGHANEWVLTHEDLFEHLGPFGSVDDVNLCSNPGKPFFFTAFSCHANAFGDTRGGTNDFGPSIGEGLINAGGNRGAIASWASVGFEALPMDETSHINLYLARSMFVNPPRDEVLGDRGSRAVLGEVILSALLTNYFRRPSVEADVAVTYTLLGDPATRLSIGAPQSIVTANAVPVVNDQQIRLHTAGPNLTLDATLVSNVRLDSLDLVRIDATGTHPIWHSPDPLPAGLTLTPAFPDTAAASTQNGGRLFHLTYDDVLLPETYHYAFTTRDRYGLVSTFDALFEFQGILRSGGNAIQDNDVVPPTADLSMIVLSPAPLTPATDLTLTIGGNVQTFVANPANGDASGREWLLTWSHSPYAAGDYVVQLKPTGGPALFHSFRVSEAGGGVRLENAFAFPNPFDEDNLRTLNPGLDVAVQFSFDLITAAPADVTLRVYTISGRLIYQRTDRQLSSSWHQLGWNGRDAEGNEIANGVYFYKLLATNGTGHAVKEGRLVKLRKPRRAAIANGP